MQAAIVALIVSGVLYVYLTYRERKVKRLNALFWQRTEILGRQKIVLDRALRHHNRAIRSPDVETMIRGRRLFKKRMKNIEAATVSLFEGVSNGH